MLLKLKYLSFLIEIFIVIFFFYSVSPVVDNVFFSKFIAIHNPNQAPESFEMLYPASRRMEDKVLLYVCFSMITICYFLFKTSFYWAENSIKKDKALLKKVLSIRIGAFILINISIWLSLLPFDYFISNGVLAGIITGSFLPIILIITLIVLTEIRPDKSIAKKTIMDAIILYVGLPICIWLLYYIGIKFFPLIFNKYTAKILLAPVFVYVFAQFKSVKNLKNDWHEIDYFFKNKYK